jgi:signal transduction histidine kinase
VEAGKFVLQPQALNVATTLDDILVIARGLANKKSQTIETAIAPDLPPLQADPVRFKQILFNLLSNAVKFTPESGTIMLRAFQQAAGSRQQAEGREAGGPAEALLPTADCRVPPGWPSLVIEVKDTGVGIKAEDMPRLFQEFVQLEATASKRHEGTGLGLALTKRLVELHGGRIWAESEGEGKGSTFTVLLPFGDPGR